MNTDKITNTIRVECYTGYQADGGGIYILRYERDAGTWEMTLFNRAALYDRRLSST